MLSPRIRSEQPDKPQVRTTPTLQDFMSQFGKLVTRPLGKNGHQVSRLSMGLMGTSGHYGLPLPDKERLDFLDNAYDMGERWWGSGEML